MSEAECGQCFSRIIASFPCPSCESKLTRGGREWLVSSNHLHTRGLDLFLGSAPASHTCMIPLECLVTSFFPEIYVYMCPRSSLFVMQALPDQVCGSQRYGLLCEIGQHGEKTNRHVVVFANANINLWDLASDIKTKQVCLLLDYMTYWACTVKIYCFT